MRPILLIAGLLALTTIQPIQKMEPRFTVLTLGVDNLEKSLAFYRDGLGFQTEGIVGKQFEHGEIVFIKLNHNMELSLYSRKDLAWGANVPQTAVSPSEFTIGYNVRKKEEVDTLMEFARKAGARITKAAHHAFWGGYSGYFQDPDGHLWEIVYNPDWNPDAP
jgi:catechol 2,3-dioxygenase-like lactoylglutathione lyase family enzyme